MARSSVRTPVDAKGGPHRQDADWRQQRIRRLARAAAVTEPPLVVSTLVVIGVMAV